MLSQSELNELFIYKDGELYYRNGASNPIAANYNQRKRVWVNGTLEAVYRVIWVMHNGDIPEGIQIDHRDRNPLNNKLSNLRLATANQNCFNIGKRKTNKTNYKGVSWCKNMKKWYASMSVDGEKQSLGYYDSVKDAARAYEMAATFLHGEFVNLV